MEIPDGVFVRTLRIVGQTERTIPTAHHPFKLESANLNMSLINSPICVCVGGGGGGILYDGPGGSFHTNFT